MKKGFTLLLTLFPALALAETEIKANSEINRSQQQNKYQLEQLQQERQQNWLEKRQYQADQKQAETADLSQVCLPYQGIRFAGFTLVDPTPFAPQNGECLNEVRLNQLSKSLTQAYLDQGYIYNPFQFEDDQSGILTMRVTEGKVSQLTTKSERLNLDTIFPDLIGKPLNVKELDQGLDQANKMPNSKISVDVLPSKNGDIELSFVNEEKNRVTGFVGVDNFASKTYKRWQAKAGLNIDSPFGLSDSFYLVGSHSLKSLKGDYQRSASLFHSIPYGDWSFSYFSAISKSAFDLPLEFSTVRQEGRTLQTGVKTDYTFHRGSNHISNIYGQLEHTNSKSYFQDSLIELQSPRLTSLHLGLSHLQLFPNGSLVAEMNYEQGMKWWNSSSNKGNDLPEGQFKKWQGELNLNYYHQLSSQLFRQTHRLTGQYSSNYLYSIKQADMLGRYAVRGFNDYSVSAEKSLVLQNSLTWMKTVNEWQFEPYLAFDLGIQKSKFYEHSQKALGYAVGLNTNHSLGKFQLEWGTGRLFHINGVLQERSINLNTLIYF